MAKKSAMERERCANIAADEYVYWRDSGSEEIQDFATGAAAASANILASIAAPARIMQRNNLLAESSKNAETLRSFVKYCILHPEQRFWQALKNWSGAPKIYAALPAPWFDAPEDIVDTYEWTEANGGR